MDRLLALKVDMRSAMDGLEREGNNLKVCLQRMLSYQERISQIRNSIVMLEESELKCARRGQRGERKQ